MQKCTVLASMNGMKFHSTASSDAEMHIYGAEKGKWRAAGDVMRGRIGSDKFRSCVAEALLQPRSILVVGGGRGRGMRCFASPPSHLNSTQFLLLPDDTETSCGFRECGVVSYYTSMLPPPTRRGPSSRGKFRCSVVVTLSYIVLTF